MSGDSGTETVDAQVGRGPGAVDKLGTRVAGEAGGSYISISNRV